MSETLKNIRNSSDDFKPVTPDELNRMVKNYKDNAMPNDDTQSAWFSVKVLMALINDNEANGVRIYYGRHDKDHKLYPGRHNVILVATLDADNPDNPGCEKSKDLLHRDEASGTINNKPYFRMGADWAPLCPPRCTPPPPPPTTSSI